MERSPSGPDQIAMVPELPERVKLFPRIRFMGSKFRLLPWIHDALSEMEFGSALDAFSGSGSVAYLLKAMGKEVRTNDSLTFTSQIARAIVQNSRVRLSSTDIDLLLGGDVDADRFIEKTFRGIFFSPADLRFLDHVTGNLSLLTSLDKRALASAALTRACVKKQPRGVFTVSGALENYQDGRRDLRLTLREHFVESVAVYNAAVFDNRRANKAMQGDVFAVDPAGIDLVYLDPPYVPPADDNCYIKRYHFLEGLSFGWRGAEFSPRSRVKKLKKPFTPFGSRRTADEAFQHLFEHFGESRLVLSYSSNAYPELGELLRMMKRVKKRVRVLEREHRYHFGTHAAAKRTTATEYLIIGE